MIALLLAVAAAQPVEAAERAFAAMAQTHGQWTAFRAFAAPGAILLAPGPTDAAAFLAGRKDPPVGVMWWPARTVTSCDGSLAFSTGPWRSGAGSGSGRFLTIWQRQPDGGWKWVYDGGLAEAKGAPAGDAIVATRPRACRTPVWRPAEPDALRAGASRDDSLRWRLDKTASGYRFRVFLNPGRQETVVADEAI